VTSDRDQYLASSNLVMNFEFHERQEHSLTVGDFQLLKIFYSIRLLIARNYLNVEV
jgi:hypothetical protein